MGSIEFRGVSKRYGNGMDALADVSVRIPAGSMTFLTGHSGAGKSTFLRLLLQLERPSQGAIEVNGVDVARLPERALPDYRRHLGAVFQDHHLLANRTVYDNVALPLRVGGMREREAARRVRAALSRVGLLEKERTLPSALSTGEQQRVGIARAVVNRPKILLADEPTGNLDPELSRDIMALFQQFQQVGTTVIVASHDRELINALGSRIIELSRGHLLRDLAGVADLAAPNGGESHRGA
ncbi:MAG: cell division ATP-binding protein FtsE [Pseudomonadota bacterium]